jgi:GGDEF domain-containing protein
VLCCCLLHHHLCKASPTDFFTNISPLFTLSKIQIIRWGSNSLGIAFYPDDTTDAIKLTKYADEAMYKAKKESNTYHKFYNEM